MIILSKNGKKFLRISKTEWKKIGSDFGVQDIFDMMNESSEKDENQPKPSIEGDYTTKNPLKSMPEGKADYTTPESKEQRSIQIDNGKAYEVVPKKDGSHIRRQINLVTVDTPEDLAKIAAAPKGFEESTREDIIRDKIRYIINNFKNKQFLFIGFWEKTKSSTWRHMWGQIVDRISYDVNNPEKWSRLKILDRAIGQVREVLIDNIDYIRGSGISYVVDRVAANAHVNEKYPEGKAGFVGSALSAARKAIEQSKAIGDKA